MMVFLEIRDINPVCHEQGYRRIYTPWINLNATRKRSTFRVFCDNGKCFLYLFLCLWENVANILIRAHSCLSSKASPAACIAIHCCWETTSRRAHRHQAAPEAVEPERPPHDQGTYAGISLLFTPAMACSLLREQERTTYNLIFN